MNCRICASPCGVRRDEILEWLMLDAWPSWLDGICDECAVCRHDDTPATEGRLNELLVSTLHEMTRRQAQGKLLSRCEVLEQSCYWDGSTRCCRFADRERLGRLVCFVHQRGIDRGRTVAFVDTHEFAHQLFMIWASTKAEFLAEANRIAAGLSPK